VPLKQQLKVFPGRNCIKLDIGAKKLIIDDAPQDHSHISKEESVHEKHPRVNKSVS